MSPVPEQLVRFINSGTKFLVAGHKEPDGDCVASQLALCTALQRLGKEAAACSAGPFKRTEIAPYAAHFISAPGEKEKAGAKVIVVDCSTVERTGSLAPCLEGLPVAVIDHHAVTAHPSPAPEVPVYIDHGSPSCTLLILALIEALGLEPSGEEAGLLLFGLCTDTGFFRHLDTKGAAAFEAAAKLIRAGASPKETFSRIHGGKSLDTRVFMGHILSRAESLFNGKLIISYETFEETQRFGQEGRDSDSLYQMLQSVAGVEAIAIIRQELADSCTVGFRSIDKIDVAAVAAAFGGGGHKNAAGVSIKGTISDVKPRIIETFTKIFH